MNQAMIGNYNAAVQGVVREQSQLERHTSETRMAIEHCRERFAVLAEKLSSVTQPYGGAAEQRGQTSVPKAVKAPVLDTLEGCQESLGVLLQNINDTIERVVT